MAQDIFASNGPTTTVAAAHGVVTAGTSETWTVASSTGFPAAVTGVSQFRVADRAAPTEIMIVTNVSGTTWTVTRGTESTAPVAHSAGFTVYQALTTGILSGLVVKPAAAEAIIYVSNAASAGDGNDGLSWGSAKATLAGALAAGALFIQVGHGTFTINAADGHGPGAGNGVTLTVAGTVLQGLGVQNTRIVVSANADYGICAAAQQCTIRDLYLEAGTGYTVTYGIGVTAAISSEKCSFWNLRVESGAGTVTNGFAVGPDVATDIANTSFFNCSSDGTANAAWILGNGSAGNVLDTRMFGCNAVASPYGVYANASGFAWYGGDFGENTTCDIYLNTLTPGDKVVVDGARSENSAALLGSGNNGSAVNVAIRNYVFQSSDAFLPSTGAFISYGYSGSLTLDNVTARNYSGSVTLVALFTDQANSLTVTATACKTTTPLSQLFYSLHTQYISILATSYTQTTAAGGSTGAVTAGPVRLAPGFTATTVNGTSRYLATPVETQTLASNGAVTITGLAESAEVTLNANATSSSVTNLYPGQRLTITWIQGAAGGKTYAWPSSAVWAGGTAPANVTGAGKQETASFVYDGTYLQQVGVSYGQIPGGAVNMASVHGTASSVTGSSGTSYIMAGLAAAFTPAGTGKVVINCAGAAGLTAGSSTRVTVLGCYGTGTAPANGAAVAGTGFGQGGVPCYCVPVNGTATPFAVLTELTGLTTGTAYWFDLAFVQTGSSTTTLGSLSWVIQEVG